MSDADLQTFLNELNRVILDPSAPLPSLWPTGAMGVFLIFVTQIGAGIPLGVLLARNSGINPVATAGLYLASDVVLAFTTEPLLLALRWLSLRVDFLARLGDRFARFTGATGLSTGRVKGPLGLILFSFAVAPAPARAASEAAGHGFFSGWSLAIIGDMLYFSLIMASTLLVTGLFGDSRLTITAVVLAAWLIPMLVQRWRRGSTPSVAAPKPLLQVATATPAPRPARRLTRAQRRRQRSG